MQLSVNKDQSRYPKPAKTSDAFGSLSTWLDSPRHAFDTWISREAAPVRLFANKPRPYERSTLTVYIAMFNKFCSWVESLDRGIHEVDAQDIHRFLDAEVTKDGNKKRHRKAYVHLLERVYDRMIALGWPGINPARSAARKGAAKGKDDQTRFMSTTERDRLICYVETEISKIEKNPDGDTFVKDWIETRDMAMGILILGGGAKVDEVRHMTLNCVHGDGTIRLGTGATARTILLLDFARPILTRWIAMHKSIGLPIIALFPAMRMGKRRQLTADPSSPMHQATIHRRINRLLTNAGINLGVDVGSRLCAQTLRNSFASALLDDDRDDSHLAMALGITLHAAGRLRRSCQCQRIAKHNAASMPHNNNTKSLAELPAYMRTLDACVAAVKQDRQAIKHTPAKHMDGVFAAMFPCHFPSANPATARRK